MLMVSRLLLLLVSVSDDTNGISSVRIAIGVDSYDNDDDTWDLAARMVAS